jgi:NADH:ubiquinone oxidoreductase subunit 5 (subunit L)/multisubunit Na+/H+ antiporter MnhA subunit
MIGLDFFLDRFGVFLSVLFVFIGLMSYNLLLIFILWEISTFAIWRAVGFYRKEENIYAANFTFLINFAAAAIMLIGLVMLYLDNGTFNFFDIKIYNDLAAVFILIGILAKSVRRYSILETFYNWQLFCSGIF